MTFRTKNRRLICAAVCAGVILALGGCGGEGEKTQSAMGMIQELNYTEALEMLDAAQEEGENLRMVNRARGIAYMGLTDYAQAAACFKEALAGSEDFDKVISMDPYNYDRVIEIHEVLEYFGFGEDGKVYLRAALENKDKPMDKYAVGRIYYYLGEYQNACLALEEAREKGGAESYLYLGKAYEATGDYNYAANVYNSYISKNGGTAEVYNQLGLCEMAKGEYQKALEAFQTGKRMENATMLQTLSFNEIVAYEHLGEFKQAYELMGTYLKNYPDDEQAKREYEFLSTR